MIKRPIIVMGMHRSGTTLISRVLNDLGVFMGKKVDKNYEALFFLDLNRWIFNQLGGRWDYPPKMDSLFLNQEIYNLIIEYLHQCIRGPKFVKYLGAKNYLLKGYGNDSKTFLWGWKDPRNVYTLPIWLRMFPDAKIIYIERHGVDVANSLRKRSQTNTKVAIDKFKKKKWRYLFYDKREGFRFSLRCTELEGAFSLWEEYLQQAHMHLDGLDNQILKLQYEVLLEAPDEACREIAEFIEIKSKDAALHTNRINIHSEKAYRYKKNPELVAFAKQVSHRLQSYEE